MTDGIINVIAISVFMGTVGTTFTWLMFGPFSRWYWVIAPPLITVWYASMLMSIHHVPC